MGKNAESFDAEESRREWTFLWKPKNEGWGNSVYATNLKGAKEQVLKTYPKGSSFFQRADLSTLTDDSIVNKQRWRNWDSQWNAESFGAEYTLGEMAKKSFRDIDKISGFVADRLLHDEESWANLTILERKESLNKIREDEDIGYLYDGGFGDGETTILTKKQLKKYLDENHSSDDNIEIGDGYIAKHKNVWEIEYLVVEELDYDEDGYLKDAESFDTENWGGDPEGPLAKALEKARKKSKKSKKPLKIEKLGSESFSAEWLSQPIYNSCKNPNCDEIVVYHKEADIGKNCDKCIAISLYGKNQVCAVCKVNPSNVLDGTDMCERCRNDPDAYNAESFAAQETDPYDARFYGGSRMKERQSIWQTAGVMGLTVVIGLMAYAWSHKKDGE